MEKEKLSDLNKELQSGLRDASDDLINRLKHLDDDDLLRASQSLDLFAVVESNRRLRNALQREEKVIKNLTLVLVILTGILIVLAVIQMKFSC